MKKFILLCITCSAFCIFNSKAQNLSISLSPHQFPNGFNLSAHNAGDGSINATVSNAVGPVTFLWNDNITTEDRTNLAAGIYSVVVTDSLDSTATATVTLTQPAAIQPLEIIFQKSTFPGGYNISSFGGANGSITITVTGGQSPYTYSWSTGAVTKDLAGLTAGSYTVTVTDNLGTTATGTQTLLQPGQPLSVQITGNSNPCGNAATNFINAMVSGGTPPYQYQWLMGGVVLPNSTSMLNVPVAGGTFGVKVRDANQDSAMASYTAQMLPPPLMVMVNPIYYPNGQAFSCPTCSDGRLVASVIGGTAPYTFSWTGGSNNDSVAGLAPSATPYSVTVTDANGCTGYGSYTLASMPPPSPLMITGNTSMFAGAGNVSCLACTDGYINLTVSGGVPPYNYNWGGGITTQNRSNLGTGMYSVTATDMNGATATQSFNLMFYSPPPPPMPLIITGNTSMFAASGNVSCMACTDGYINLTVSGGMPPYTYNWGGGITTQNRSNLPTGMYSVTVTDMNGATATQNFNLVFNAPPPPPANLIVTGNTSMFAASGNVSCMACTDGYINLTVSGGMPPYTYNWGGGITTQNRNNLGAGMYAVTVTDMNGATATQNFNLVFNAPPPPPANLIVTGNTSMYPPGANNVSCITCTDGYINLTVSGGMPPYTFDWGGGITIQNRTNLPTGMYSVTVTDMNGATVNQSFNMVFNAPPPPPANLIITGNISMFPGTGNVTCMACTDGFINLTVSGGMPPYTYNWGGGITTQNRSNLPTGMYAVTVTDMNGTTATQNFSLTYNPPPPSITIVGNTSTYSGTGNVTCTTCTDGWINLTVSGGVPPYTYNWGNGITIQNRTNLPTGMYSVTVTDMTGTTASQNFNLMFYAPPPPPANLIVTGNTSMFPPGGNNVSCMACTDGSINLTVSGGMPPYTYNWGGGITTQNRSNLPTGLYSVTVTDMNGATVNQSFSLVFNGPPVPIADAWGFVGNPGAGKWIGTSDSTDLVVKTNSNERIRIGADGGTTINGQLTLTQMSGSVNCATLLGVNSSGRIIGLSPQDQCFINLFNSSNTFWKVGGNTATTNSFIGTVNNQDLRIRTNDSLRMVVKSTGEVLIGTDVAPAGYMFAVKGKAIAEEMEVRLHSDWPDYVFAKDYKLPPLSEVQTIINQQGHLPGMPAAADVKSNGINLGEMDALLLQKIEELTLYMLQLQQQNEELKKQVDELKK